MQAKTVQQAWTLNNPLLIVKGASSLAGKALFRTDNGSIAIDAVKRAENSNELVLRLHEYTGSRGQVVITSDWRIQSWQECDLMERPIGESIQGEHVISFSVTPYEIKTFLIQLSSKSALVGLQTS